MKKIIVRGPVLTQSGYGVHCRQIAEWLLSKPDIDVKFQALPWGDTPLILNKLAYNGLIEKIIKNAIDVVEKSEHQYDVSFQLQLPNEWDPTLAKFNVGMTAVVETDVANPTWVNCCNQMDLIIVPSAHAAMTLRKSGTLTKPIVIVPESFSNEILKSDEELPQLSNFSTDFNFLVFGQITGDNPYNDRKNIYFTIKWFCETFKDDKNVGLVIKTNSGRNTPIDKEKTKQIIKAIIKECRKTDFPKIHLLHGDMSNDEVAALYKHKQIMALLTLTRGEGFGLPILEAAASGLPVIATGWSGHMDFLNHGKFINLSYNLKEIHSTRVDEKIFLSHMKWAEVIEEDVKKKLLKFKSSSFNPKQWALELSSVIKQKYCHDSIKEMYNQVTKEFL